MSRGHGSVQREILAALRELEPGRYLIIGGGWPAGRRAAHRLAAEGLLTLRAVLFEGRWCLAVEHA